MFQIYSDDSVNRVESLRIFDKLWHLVTHLGVIIRTDKERIVVFKNKSDAMTWANKNLTSPYVYKEVDATIPMMDAIFWEPET